MVPGVSCARSRMEFKKSSLQSEELQLDKTGISADLPSSGQGSGARVNDQTGTCERVLYVIHNSLPSIDRKGYDTHVIKNSSAQRSILMMHSKVCYTIVVGSKDRTKRETISQSIVTLPWIPTGPYRTDGAL